MYVRTKSTRPVQKTKEEEQQQQLKKGSSPPSCTVTKYTNADTRTYNLINYSYCVSRFSAIAASSSLSSSSLIPCRPASSSSFPLIRKPGAITPLPSPKSFSRALTFLSPSSSLQIKSALKHNSHPHTHNDESEDRNRGN